jgi:hypothetical protein
MADQPQNDVEMKDDVDTGTGDKKKVVVASEAIATELVLEFGSALGTF